jgi:hypothetical protein
MHGLGAVGRDALVLAGGQQRLPDGEGVPRADVDLVGELAGEADAADARGDARDGRVAPGHERERVVAHVEVRRDAAEHGA